MSNNYNMFQGNQGGFVNNQDNFPTLGGQDPSQQQQYHGQQPGYGGFPPQQQQFGGFPGQGAPFGQQQQQFPGFPPPQFQAPPMQAQAAPAGGANPFAAAATANPFAAAKTSNPFASGGIKEFKPIVKKGIMDDDDDAPIDFAAGGGKKKKQKSQAELDAEKAKAKAEADAKLSYKGKPSTFFIMDHVPGDARDPSGNNRVPTTEQSTFIFTHYPMSAQPNAMIMKIYELYKESAQAEESEKRQKEAYNKPTNRKTQQQQIEEQEEIIDLDEDTTFGMQPKKQNKKTAKAAAQKAEDSKRPSKVPQKTDGEREEKKKAVVAIKDIIVVPDESCVPVDEARSPASFVFIGHVDAGKSTICGNLIYSMGIVDERTIEKFKKEAKDKGRDSWWLAYVMDSSDEEKAKGKTVEMGRAVIDTPKKMYTIFDAPGHKNYVPNMIMGATLADYGGLVISARRGEFEAGFEQDGQTREHIQLARSLGISKIVVVVNKMDEGTVNWKKARWDQIQDSLSPFLLQCGYTADDIFWVPISGLTGANIVEPVASDVCSWYQGPTLIDILDNLPVEPRNGEAPVRIPVLDKMKDGPRTVVFGKVEQGTVRLGDKLLTQPSGLPCQVLNIINDKQQQVEYGRSGDNVQLKISYLEEDQINKGDVLCPRDQPMAIAQVIEAEVELLELNKPIFSKGSQSMMHIHTYADEVSIKEIKWAKEKDPNTGEEVKKELPKFTRSFAKCLVRIATKTPIPLEKIDECPQLGRFTLRDEGKTIAIGRIMRFIPFNKDKLARPASAAASASTTTTAKHADIVFNMETGQAEEVKPSMAAIAEEQD